MTPTRYEWNEAKRVENLERHGVDFMAVHGFDWPTAVVFEDRRRDYGETRMLAYGKVAERLHVLVYTRRPNARRIISLRKANAREQAAYAAGRPDRPG
jgi:uncharacterized DUF497 family protein